MILEILSFIGHTLNFCGWNSHPTRKIHTNLDWILWVYSAMLGIFAMYFDHQSSLRHLYFQLQLGVYSLLTHRYQLLQHNFKVWLHISKKTSKDLLKSHPLLQLCQCLQALLCLLISVLICFVVPVHLYHRRMDVIQEMVFVLSGIFTL